MRTQSTSQNYNANNVQRVQDYELYSVPFSQPTIRLDCHNNITIIGEGSINSVTNQSTLAFKMAQILNRRLINVLTDSTPLCWDTM